MFSRSSQKTHGIPRLQKTTLDDGQVAALRNLGLLGLESARSTASGGSWRSDFDRPSYPGGVATSAARESFPEKSTLTSFSCLVLMRCDCGLPLVCHVAMMQDLFVLG